MLWWLEDCRQESMKSPTTMENNSLQRSNIKYCIVESYPFHHCIRPLLFLQKIAGGWIYRPLRSTDDKVQYYAFQIYCIFWALITFGSLIRTLFVFNTQMSINVEDMVMIMTTSLYIVTSISQFASYFKYKNILPFWDGLIQLYPQRFEKQLGWPKISIWVMVIMTMCTVFGVIGSEVYLTLKVESESAYMKVAEPWSGSIKDAKVTYMIVTICFLLPYTTWVSACLMLIVAAYYLQWGFRDLQKLMSDDTHLVQQLAFYKRRHLSLVQMTRALDNILWGYIGGSVVMHTFYLCFVIFMLRNSHRSMDTLESAFSLFLALCTMTIIVVLSVSINTWVSCNALWRILPFPMLSTPQLSPTIHRPTPRTNTVPTPNIFVSLQLWVIVCVNQNYEYCIDEDFRRPWSIIKWSSCSPLTPLSLWRVIKSAWWNANVNSCMTACLHQWLGWKGFGFYMTVWYAAEHCQKIRNYWLFFRA